MECLLHLGVEDFKIALGNVGFFAGIVAGLNLSVERADALRSAIDHKDCAWLEKEVEGLNLSAEKREFLIQLPNYSGGREVLDQALAVVQNPRSRDALARLAEIQSVIEALDLADFLAFDLAEVRGLDYYTGIVFKIYSRFSGFELGGGGRYDGLLSKFGWDLPAVGFSFTLDRLLPLIRDIDSLSLPAQDAEELVVATERVALPELFRQVWNLRQQGLPVRLGRAPKC